MSKEPIDSKRLLALGLKSAEFGRYAARLPTGTVLIYQTSGQLYCNGNLLKHVESEEDLRDILESLGFKPE